MEAQGRPKEKVAALAKQIAGLSAEIEIINAVDPDGAKFLLRELAHALQTAKELMEE